MAQADVIFPSLTADDLNGWSLELPADFPGTPTVVFIANKRNQQLSIDAWVEHLGLLESEGPAWVELPVVGVALHFLGLLSTKGCALGLHHLVCGQNPSQFTPAEALSTVL